MADRDYKVEGSVDGPYYVDDNCIDCDLCRSTAGFAFERNPSLHVSFVYRQPETEEELRLCEKALAECPVEAIGRDGAMPV